MTTCRPRRSLPTPRRLRLPDRGRGTTIRRGFVREFRSAGGCRRDWGDIAISEPQGSAAALVRTRSVAPGADFSRWVQDAYAATEPGLHSVRMLDVQACGLDLVRAAFDYGSQVFQGRAHVVGVREGDLAALFIAAAARAEFVQRLPTLLQILDSLRFAPGPGRQFHERLRQCRLPWDFGAAYPDASRERR